MQRFLVMGFAVFVLAGFQATGYTAVSDHLPSLTVSFASPVWDGIKVPSGQQCKKYGGKGATPSLVVSGIPAGANAVIVEFNDMTYAPLSYDGGHGKVGFWVSGSTATLKSVPGGTAKMPAGTFLEARNRAGGAWASPGYLPPCSGGRGNTYAAVLKAVYKPKVEGEKGRLLAIGRITLGTY